MGDGAAPLSNLQVLLLLSQMQDACVWDMAQVHITSCSWAEAAA